MTKHTAGAVVKTALGEVGYLEKKTNSNLDDKTANAGYNNYTKYARDLDATKMYNGKKNGYAWCDMFNDWCHLHVSGFERAQKALCQPNGGAGAGCQYSLNYYKTAGRSGSKPKLGAQIFFAKTKASDAYHTGIVYAYDDKTVYTVEGNTSGASGVVENGGGVKKKSYAVGYDKIKAYGYPKYDIEPLGTGKHKATKGLAVRKDAAKKYDKIGSIAKGTSFAVSKVKVNNAGSTWGYVASKGGWVCMGKAGGARYVESL